MEISSLRKKIDEIDRKILDLLSERGNIALDIGRTKRNSNLSIHHPDRENQILERLETANNGPLSREQIRNIFTQIIIACKKIQG